MKKNAVNQAEFKARQKEKNLVRLDEWVTPDQKINIKAYLRGEAEINLKQKVSKMKKVNKDQVDKHFYEEQERRRRQELANQVVINSSSSDYSSSYSSGSCDSSSSSSSSSSCD